MVIFPLDSSNLFTFNWIFITLTVIELASNTILVSIDIFSFSQILQQIHLYLQPYRNDKLAFVYVQTKLYTSACR